MPATPDLQGRVNRAVLTLLRNAPTPKTTGARLLGQALEDER
ncbi:MAG: hypothetical protein ACKVPX_08915 [Myxococcaceae bacterium]